MLKIGPAEVIKVVLELSPNITAPFLPPLKVRLKKICYGPAAMMD